MEEKIFNGFYKIVSRDKNPFAGASFEMLLGQIEDCSFRCEAGPLEKNLAYIELKRQILEVKRRLLELSSPGSPEVRSCLQPARVMIWSPSHPLDPTYSCMEHIPNMVESGDVIASGDLPAGAKCCYCFSFEKVEIREGDKLVIPGIETGE